MKKAFSLALAFAAFALVSLEAKAQTVPSTQLPPSELRQELQRGKQEIKKEELPEGVKQALQHDVLKEWQVSGVYKVVPVAPVAADIAPVYEVYFTNAAQQHTVARFDETGEALAGDE
ncbi:hypothetical protein [Pontibacter akesuensis]|uniref:Peptidase propeptide and YPEB domain-containing protein n=1 Tax=Pontibacter akesuensis TaxID=388950 RepID=A0A1I7I8J2_9BACT|nr:hypothetical protein [Pontibacter akesuensis]GHA65758.1 hypothetical protein GCM10007389_18360 [Pontibacter akesuensis]SFU69174.1 hypothetical protein SAMN04487941_2003 [Pontibacter akesuensis]